MSGPLAGVRILDFTTNMAGPFATMILGDQGADVVKVEPPGGDVIRTMGTTKGGVSAYFVNLNRSKRSICIDLSHSSASRVLEALLDGSDVVVHSFRPGVAEQLGLDVDGVTRHRAGLIYVQISGFGDDGPYAGRPAYDHIIQAMAGFAAVQTDPKTGQPALVRQGVVDKMTGEVAAQAIAAALFERTRTERGRVIEVSMLDVAISTLWPDGMMNHTFEDPDTVLPSIVNTFRLTPTRDGHLAFTVVTRSQIQRLLAAVGMADDERLATPEGRFRHGGEVLRQAVSRLSQLPTEEAVELLVTHQIPVAPVVSLEELADHPQVRGNGSVDQFEDPRFGILRQANPAVRFESERVRDLRRVPELGEHTVEILEEAGLRPDAIGELKEAGVLAP